jgi:hypothetical protein
MGITLISPPLKLTSVELVDRVPYDVLPVGLPD